MSLLGSNSRGAGFLVVLGLWASGCQFIFGDFTQEQTDSSAVGGHASVGGSGPAQSCERNGTFRCSQANLESCDSGQWRTIALCATAERCDAERGLCLDCVKGTNRCIRWRLETCATTGDRFATTAECDSDENCDAAIGECRPCLANEAFCSGASLYVCNDEQSGWDLRECSKPELCNVRARDCRPCVEGEYQCNGASLQRCNGEQVWVSLDECASNELCEKSLGVQASAPAAFLDQCEPKGCEPNAYRCNPEGKNELQACPPSLLGWETLFVCRTAALCDATNGHCDEPICEPGTYRCNGVLLELCRQDATGYRLSKVCSSAAYCNATKRDCVPCLEGEFDCSDSKLRKCSSDQTWGAPVECGSVALCDDVNGECIPRTCNQDEFHCEGDLLQVCSADLTTWAPKDTCAAASLCDEVNGRCNPPECAVGAARCTGNTYQACDPTTRKWGTPEACTSSQLCSTVDPAVHCVAGCTTIPFQCNDGTLERCVVNTTTNVEDWASVATCRAQSFCYVSGSTAYCHDCNSAEAKCTNASALSLCSTLVSGQRVWGVASECASGTCTDNAGYTDVCAQVCTPGTVDCGSTPSVITCQLDGSGWTTTEVCGGSKPFCDNATCVECSSDAHCMAGTKTHCSLGACVTCSLDSHCAVSSPHCVLNECVVCRNALDCASGETCSSAGQCISLTSSAGAGAL